MLRETFRKTIASCGMDRLMVQSGVVIAAFSGGADSSVMLRLLADYTGEKGIRLVCAHVNHMIRGAEADSDERFARETAESLGIPIYVRCADVPAYAKKMGCGLEEAARTVRYAFFDELSAELTGEKNAVIATAHNADDNMETVLFNLMRGSGLKGLGGIDPIRDGRFIRPLIGCTGEEIRNYCHENGISYVVDSTNADTEYTRNYIRHKIVPVMEAAFDAPQRSVLRMTELLREDSDFLEREATAHCPGNTAEYEREELVRLHPALSARILMRMYANARGTGELSLEYVHIKNMLRLASSDKCEGSFSLPGMVDFRVTRNRVYFCSTDRGEPGTDENFRFALSENGGIFENERYKIIVSQEEHTVCTEEYENIYKLSIHQKMCFDKIVGALYIKYRNNGDTYRYGGMTRKVKKLMVDKKLTADEKRLLPLLCDDRGIVWMPYYPVRDSVSVHKKEEKILHLYFFDKLLTEKELDR